jgi:hypothetical protein
MWLIASKEKMAGGRVSGILKKKPLYWLLSGREHLVDWPLLSLLLHECMKTTHLFRRLELQNHQRSGPSLAD